MRITVKAFLAHFTIWTGSVARTIDAFTSQVVANAGVSIALTRLAIRETIITWQTFVTNSTIDVGNAGTLTGSFVAKIRFGPKSIAIARLTTLRTKSEKSGHAAIASSTHNVAFTKAITSKFVANGANGASQIA